MDLYEISLNILILAVMIYAAVLVLYKIYDTLTESADNLDCISDCVPRWYSNMWFICFIFMTNALFKTTTAEPGQMPTYDSICIPGVIICVIGIVTIGVETYKCASYLYENKDSFISSFKSIKLRRN